MPKAKWTTDSNEIETTVVDGTFSFTAPLYDDGVLQGTVTINMNDDRELVFTWEAEPGATGLSDFRAWSTA